MSLKSPKYIRNKQIFGAKIQIRLKVSSMKSSCCYQRALLYLYKREGDANCFNIIHAWMGSCVLLGGYSKLGTRCQMNNIVVLKSRPLETSTQFSSCLPGYLFENDSRVVPEKFEGEPLTPVIPLHSQNLISTPQSIWQGVSWMTADMEEKP